ncbi:FHA domain-containing protein [Motilibacter aurantiacus]|uniref:FHA domain-containing protein n=1 Tax=Motilibacter aurantiacus TaxID=2714955 RepID=UPI001409AA71|nr:FHA domain-containing protein [Motilibacter aurantiacus]NHC47040.1 FHA domain-containing protein [Motilibacter aurantiacus]
MPVCTNCGHANPDDARFCSNCGSSLRAAGGPGGADITSTQSISGLAPVGPGTSAETDADASGDLPAVSAADLAAVEALPPGSALLVVRRGPNAGSRFLLDEDVTTAGRHPESDIFLDDVTVSRRHAEFVRVGAGFTVRDVGSLNGTYVNRERIDEVVLVDGDEVQVGKYRMVFLPSGGGAVA